MNKKIGLVFPGSGSQYVGMGKKIYNDYGSVRQTFEEASEVLGYDLSKICLEGSVINLNKPRHVLASLLTISVSYFRVYMEEIGIAPSILAGHSLGEYSALCCSGAISFEDALKILLKRGALAEKVCKLTNGTMSALNNVSHHIVEKICDELQKQNYCVCISCYNSKNQVLISGNEDGIKLAEKEILKEHGEIVPFIGSPPYHSPLMKDIIDELEEELRKHKYLDLNYPVIANTTARPYESKDTISEHLIQHMYRPVRWLESIEYMKCQGIDVIVEAGPSNVLKNLIKDQIPQMKVLAMDEIQDLEQLLELKQTNYMGKNKLQDMKHKAIAMCLGIAVSTKNNNNDLEAHNTYLEAYKNIKNLRDKYAQDKSIIQDTHVIEAFTSLDKIFDSRLTSQQERQYRYEQLIEQTQLQEIYREFQKQKS
ncbi:ACP S-malonyltransferase [Vallitalea maricola]|uniref:Uncharacterized protein n=1 Tax=Vallitalea maricola TaxID=3074433 RepID=A0ACB5UJN9_9FIRM|nr:hypothetical protein AN2V17_22030 [Vallitalea sp. AN17-2]